MAFGNETVLERFVTEIGFRDLPGSVATLNKMQGRLKSMQATTAAASRNMMMTGAALAAPLIGVASTAIKTSEAFNTLRARTNASIGEMAQFRKQALDVGSQLPLDTEDIVRAQTLAVQNGLTIIEAMAATPITAKFAVAAEGMGIEQATDYLTVAKNAFGLAADDLGKVADMMLYAETKMPVTAQQLGEGFQYSAYTARQMGVELEEYISILGSFGKSGRGPEQASQGFQLLLQNLAKMRVEGSRGGAIVKKTFEAIGISVNEVEATLDRFGLTGLFELMNRRLAAGKMSKEEFTAITSQLGGSSYGAGLMAAIEDAPILRDVQAGLLGAVGTELDRQVEEQMSGLAGAWKQVLANIDTIKQHMAGVGVGDLLEKTFGGFNEFVSKLTKTKQAVDDVTGEMTDLWRFHFEAVRDGEKEMLSADATNYEAALALVLDKSGLAESELEYKDQTQVIEGEGFVKAAADAGLFGVALLGLGAVLRVVSWSLGGFAAVVGGVSAAMTWATKVSLGTRIALAGMAAWSAITAGALKLVTAATWLWNAALALNPIVWVVAGIATLVAAGYLLWKNWDAVSAAVGAAWDWMADKAEQAVNLIVDGMNWIIKQANKVPAALGFEWRIPDIPEIGGEDVELNVGVGRTPKIAAPEAGEIVPKWARATTPEEKQSMFDQSAVEWEAMKAGFGDAMGWMKDRALAEWTWIKNAASSFSSSVGAQWTYIAGMFGAAWDWMGAKAVAIIDTVTGAFSRVGDMFRSIGGVLGFDVEEPDAMGGAGEVAVKPVGSLADTLRAKHEDLTGPEIADSAMPDLTGTNAERAIAGAGDVPMLPTDDSTPVGTPESVIADAVAQPSPATGADLLSGLAVQPNVNVLQQAAEASQAGGLAHLAAPLPAAPPTTVLRVPEHGMATGQPPQVNAPFTVENIEINVAGGDPDEVAEAVQRGIEEHSRREWRAIVEQMDSALT